ncbi:MAG TPA: ribosome small subunit-dependent GTPase A, partial [Syntrophomonas sp.]|nr:ribosome small subunit-dependent GTPase A [Syntrophomonas sp.]
MTNGGVEGLVIKNYGGFYYVQDAKDIYECKLRGKIKQAVLTGDKVIFTPL